ncbi:MAG: DUF58 domain-containing protein [Succinimonas sp.]|nr:DUF58 domain-containing protein [Succinimonas sp.]
MPNGIELKFEELMLVPPLSQLLPNIMVASQRYGLLRANSRGRGMEFSEVRSYQPGDDIRTIDWRITARTGKTFTKLFREERDRNVYIILDLDPAMYFGSQGQLKARFAALIAASCAWQAFDMKDKVGGMIILGDTPIRHKPGGMRGDMLAWIRKVYEAYQIGLRRQNFDYSISNGLEIFVNHARPGSVFHIISDFYRLNDNAWLYLRRLNKSHIVRTYQIYDKLEMEIDGKGTVGINTGNNHGYISSLNRDFVENYRRIGVHRIHNINRMLTEASQKNICIDVSDPLLGRREEQQDESDSSENEVK